MPYSDAPIAFSAMVVECTCDIEVRMRPFRCAVAAATVVSALLLAACGESVVAPSGGIAAPKRAALTVTVATPPTVRRDLEGQFWVCKAANIGAPMATFTFTYSATKPLGTLQPDLLPGSFSIQNGECAMIYAIDREVSVKRYTVTVTEGAMPNANWAFTTATAFTIIPPEALNILGTPVINGQEVSDVGFIHDQGAILTITNTFTPPPPPTCTYTQGFWKTHQELWDANNEMVVWNGQTFFNTGRSYAYIYTLSAAGGNSFVQLAHQYIAAKLNLNGGSDPTINSAMTQAEALFSGLASGTTFIKNATWTNLATVLDNYNKGVTGPGHCN